MNKIVDHINNVINETIICLQRVKNYDKSIDKYTWVKVTVKIELDVNFGPMFFGGLLGVNLHLTESTFSPKSDFSFSSVMSKNCFQLLRTHLCFANAEEKSELWRLINSSLNNYVALSEYLTIGEAYIQ